MAKTIFLRLLKTKILHIFLPHFLLLNMGSKKCITYSNGWNITKMSIHHLAQFSIVSFQKKEDKILEMLMGGWGKKLNWKKTQVYLFLKPCNQLINDDSWFLYKYNTRSILLAKYLVIYIFIKAKLWEKKGYVIRL